MRWQDGTESPPSPFPNGPLSRRNWIHSPKWSGLNAACAKASEARSITSNKLQQQKAALDRANATNPGRDQDRGPFQGRQGVHRARLTVGQPKYPICPQGSRDDVPRLCRPKLRRDGSGFRRQGTKVYSSNNRIRGIEFRNTGPASSDPPKYVYGFRLGQSVRERIGKHFQ